MRWLALLLFTSVGCASLPKLPPTSIPVCAHIPDVVCRAPIYTDRSLEWETGRVCPRWELPFRFNEFEGWCYAYAGVQDERQLYRWVRRAR